MSLRRSLTWSAADLRPYVEHALGVFGPDRLPTMIKEAASFIRGHSLHLGVLLTDPGQAYDVAFTGAPPGRYPFLSRPHVGRGMRGEVVIVVE